MNRFTRVIILCFIAALMISVFPSASQSDTPVAEPPFSRKSFIVDIRQTREAQAPRITATGDGVGGSSGPVADAVTSG